jgi:glucarate dehydratase
MKITEVDLFVLDVPPFAPMARIRPNIFTLGIVRMGTDEGLVGLGEISAPSADLAHQAVAYKGRDPLAIDALGEPDPFCCALLDLAGQAYGVPLHRFFGEKVRDRVPVSYWSCPLEPEETAAEAEVGASLGFTNHKLKARPWNVVETVRRIRDAVGSDYSVGLDPNQKFRHVHVAARLAHELEPFGTVHNFENPVLKSHLEWFRLLREKTTIPIALHTDDAATVLQAVKAECIDYVNLSGTAQEVKKAATVAAAADVPCWVQMGGLCLGVKAAYSIHVQATIPNATLPCDELPFTREADVLEEGLTLEAGHFTVPTKPGLGVTLNMEIVDRYRIA